MAAKKLFRDSRLLLSAGTLPGTRFVDRVSAARSAGFDAISLFPQQYLAARKVEKLGPADMREILSEHQVTLDEVDPLLDWFGHGPSPAENLMFEMADEFGAGSINTPTAFAPDLTLDELTEALIRLCERAGSCGLRVDLEFLPWTIVPDLSSALAVVAAADQANLGVTLDFWHFFRSGDSIETLQALTAEEAGRITNLQLNDAPQQPQSLKLRDRLALAALVAGQVTDGIRVNGANRFFKVSSKVKNHHPDATALMMEASSGRLLPGEGDMALPQWLKVLDELGCRPTVGMEIFSLQLARLPANEVAGKAMAAWRGVCE